MKLFGFISVYGLLIASAVLTAVLYMRSQEERLSLPKDISVDFALWALPIGILGARIYYCVFNWARYASDPVSVLYIWQGGLAIYGGIIGGAVGMLLLARRRKLPIPALLDLAAPALLLAQAIGRWGNFFNQEAYGADVTDPGLQFFPYAVMAQGRWVQATFFYESAWDLTGFLILHLLRKKTKRRGSLFLLYLIWYGTGRFFIEGLRTDSLMWGSVRVSQALSLILVVVGAVLFIKRECLSGKRHET